MSGYPFHNSRIYVGKLWHSRRQGVPNDFTYPVFIWYLDLDEIAASKSWLLAFEKCGLFSYREADHGKFDTSPLPLREKINKLVLSAGLPKPHRIMLLTNLRILGYVFNPVSFFYLFDKDNRLYAAVAEVNNTFGEQKAYLIPCNNNRCELKTPKLFYVSPFIRHDSLFHFLLLPPGEKLQVVVNTENNSGFELKALLTGKAQPITTWQILKLFFMYPLLTIKIITLIHYQALRLYLKKLPYYRKAETDLLIQSQLQLQKEITYENKQ